MHRIDPEKLTRIGIVNARGTDQYALVFEYNDGSASGEEYSFQSYDSAMQWLEDNNLDDFAEDWTESEE